jgi:2-polyprenyl-3-methyl-5-hydroxy-6-metoxy-1,4-benzoquinol methylase
MSEQLNSAAAAVAKESSISLPFEPLPAFRDAQLMASEDQMADCRGLRVGILIVTYNALTTLTKVLKRITPQVWKNVEEIAVFDDASEDATYELALGLKTLRSLPKLSVLKHEQNLGYGGNQKAGYRYFLERGFDIVVLLHGDGQYAPEILSHIYHPIVTGAAEAVFGSRMLKTYGGPLKGGMPVYKYLGNRILSIFENRSLGLNLSEFHSGYRAYSLKALRQIDFSEMTNDFHFDTEIIIKLNHQGYQIREVPIPTYYGTEICYVNGMRYARDVYRAVRRYKRTCSSIEISKEFKEYAGHYPAKQSKHSSHYYVRELVGANRTVLDLGCGVGHVAAALKENGNQVTGVDVLPAAVNHEAFERYFSADMSGGIAPVLQCLEGRRFERILLLDILEHLHRPERVLEQCHQALAPGGQLVISLPNVAHLSVRLMLLFGGFNYTERGILDKTHVHFFTRKTAHQMVKRCGYTIRSERFTVTPVELVLGMDAGHWFMKFTNRILTVATNLMPGLLAYQVMLVAQSDRQ